MSAVQTYPTAGDGGVGVRCEELVHIYRTGDLDVVAVRGVDLLVDPGERVALLGPSGSGKSTLLAMLGGLIPPSAGRVWVGDEEIGGLGERALLRLRSQRVGLVLQGAARKPAAVRHPDRQRALRAPLAAAGSSQRADATAGAPGGARPR